MVKIYICIPLPKSRGSLYYVKYFFLTHHIHLNILLSPPRSPLRVLNSPKGIFHTVSFHFLSILTNVVHFIVLQLKKNYHIIVYLTNCGLISFHGSLLYTSAMVCTDRLDSCSVRRGTVCPPWSLLICASLHHRRLSEGWSPAGNPLTCREHGSENAFIYHEIISGSIS